MAYIFGGDTGKTQSDVKDQRRRLAYAMLQQGMDASPLQSPWQGAARLAQALMGGLEIRQADQERKADPSPLGGSRGPTSDGQKELAGTSPAPASLKLAGSDVDNGVMNVVKDGATPTSGPTASPPVSASQAVSSRALLPLPTSIVGPAPAVASAPSANQLPTTQGELLPLTPGKRTTSNGVKWSTER